MTPDGIKQLGKAVLECYGNVLIQIAQNNGIEKPDIDHCFDVLKAEQHNILDHILTDVNEANTAFLGTMPMIRQVLNVSIQFECCRVAKLALNIN